MLLGLALAASNPASACDTGPFAIEFAAGASYLGSAGKRDLTYGKEMVQPVSKKCAGRSRLEIAFYIIDPNGRRPKSLIWDLRRRAIELYLQRIGVPQACYSVVYRHASQRPTLFEAERRQDTHVTVNLVDGIRQ